MLPSELLAQGWCQGVLAEDEQEDEVYGFMDDPRAVRFCLWGAQLAAFHGRDSLIDEHDDILNEMLGFERAHKWNDDSERTQAEVVALAKLVEIRMGLRVEGEDREQEEPLEVGVIEMVEKELVGV